jgi:hypothetical protein
VGKDVEHVARCTGGHVRWTIMDSPVPIQWPGGAAMVMAETRPAKSLLAACARVAVWWNSTSRYLRASSSTLCPRSMPHRPIQSVYYSDRQYARHVLPRWTYAKPATRSTELLGVVIDLIRQLHQVAHVVSLTSGLEACMICFLCNSSPV